MILIIFMMAQDILLVFIEFLSYLVNQIPLFDRLIHQDDTHVRPLYPHWFHVFGILAFIFNYPNDCDNYSTCN